MRKIFVFPIFRSGGVDDDDVDDCVNESKYILVS
jgi:hypothetical protein